jgi:hypothetical protein
LKVTRPHRRGFPCCGRSSCTYMPTPLPRRDRWVHLSLLPHATAAFPEILPGRLSRIGLSRPAQRSLTFRPACSLDRPRRSVPSEASTDSLPPPPLRLLPAGATRRRVGITPTENRRLFTAHSFFTLRAQSLIAVYKAIGGGWQIRLGSASPQGPIELPNLEPVDGGMPMPPAEVPNPLPGA